jgi:C4-type Zn-finger protein
MTNAENDKRRSTCSVCGKRLSIKTSSRDITWLPSQVVDEGLYCVECFKKKGGGKPTRKNQS